MIQTWEKILLDFRQPISYLIPAVVVAVMISFFCKVLTKKTMHLSVVLLIIYGYVLFQTALLSREPGTRSGTDMDLFGTWGNTSVTHAFFIENILMFIPFGVLTPMVFKRMQKIQACVFAGFLCSCGIEILQLITQRGFCQLDDMITNSAGALFGWWIWKWQLWRVGE